jgi:corrinoid protein of di/trimethylamine methyltransferase
MEKAQLFEEMKTAVLEGEVEIAGDLARQAVAEAVNPLECINQGYVAGIEEVGRLFEAGEMFLPELVAAAEVMKAALAVLEPELLKQQLSREIAGKVVIGTMFNDIHDIGKDMVASMLTASGFAVVNLGVNVPCETFLKEVRESKPDILGLSALLTTTMPEQKKVIEALEQEGLRRGVKVLVGGAPVNREWADSIGADGFAESAIEAVKVAKQLAAEK